MARNMSKHSDYIKKLKEIGIALHFSTKPRKSNDEYYREQYHLANPDCVWYQEVDPKLKDERIFPDDAIPAIVFEVLYAEEEKAMRGSVLSLPFRNPFRGILVLLRQDGESEQDYQNRKDYLYRIKNKTKYDNIDIWTEQYVDELYERIVKK